MSARVVDEHWMNLICERLEGTGWLYSDSSIKTSDWENGMYVPDVLFWLKKCTANRGELKSSAKVLWEGQELADLLDSIRDELNRVGVSDVLKSGFRSNGFKFKMVQFKPASGLNPELLPLYDANRLRVIRADQFLNDCGPVDLILLLNGLPVATIKLFHIANGQLYSGAIQEWSNIQPIDYPLFLFSEGAVVHFAVSPTEVYVTTKVSGSQTRAIPFNRGFEGSAGNPPMAGYSTDYLWEDVLKFDNWLALLGSYIFTQNNDSEAPPDRIYPRYHQWRVTERIVADVLSHGPGNRYLIQHSPGSGKTNTIVWISSFLSLLHNAQNEIVFDKVLLITDRTVLDHQLKQALRNFFGTSHYVDLLNGRDSNSSQLLKALQSEARLVVCTIQTFRFVLEKMDDLSMSTGKRHAVVIDEAHSSQGGEYAENVRQVLSSKSTTRDTDAETDEQSYVEHVVESMYRERSSGITFVAFTATPTAKTLQLFGTKTVDGSLEAFDTYTMKQAIDEGFILDVLQNYQSYKQSYQIEAKNDVAARTLVEASAARAAIESWVRRNPNTIESKVESVMSHFSRFVEPMLKNHSKSMVVVSTRQEAILWKKEIDRYIQDNHIQWKALVAFSGSVPREGGGSDWTETSKELNPHLNGRAIEVAFSTDEYRMLVVANKFQTGFDEKLLCAMYVDKPLHGVQAVQTLSRLNRTYRGEYGEKRETFVLDFVNDFGAILDAFRPYYNGLILPEPLDPEKLNALRRNLDEFGLYRQRDVVLACQAQSIDGTSPGSMANFFDEISKPILDQFYNLQRELKTMIETDDVSTRDEIMGKLSKIKNFKKGMQKFSENYAFLRLIYEFDKSFDEYDQFYRKLCEVLRLTDDDNSVDLSGLVVSHFALEKRSNDLLTNVRENQPEMGEIRSSNIGLPPVRVQYEQRVALREILEEVNGMFSEDISEVDRVDFVDQLRGALFANDTLIQLAKNPEDLFWIKTNPIDDAILEFLRRKDTKFANIQKEMLMSTDKYNQLKSKLRSKRWDIYEGLKRRAEDGHQVFISYRRDGGSLAARAIYDGLRSRRYRVFLDVEELGQGYFDDKLKSMVQSIPIFLLIASPRWSERCREPEDFVRQEIEIAMSKNKKIIPIVTETIQDLSNATLPDGIADVKRLNAVRYEHHNWKGFLDQLVDYIES